MKLMASQRLQAASVKDMMQYFESMKDRIGKKALSQEGKELPGTVYLGGNAIAEKQGAHAVISAYDFTQDKWNTFTLTLAQVKALGRI